MDISQLCTGPSEELEVYTAPPPPADPYGQTLYVSAIANSRVLLPPVSDSYNTASDVRLPKIRYPQTTSVEPDVLVDNLSIHDTETPLPRPGTNINDITNIISKCTTLCNNLDRCREQSRSEIDRQNLLHTAAQTARELLSSLGTLQEQQKKRPARMTDNGSAVITEAEESEAALTRSSRSDSDSLRPRIKRRAKRSTAGQRCHSCHTTETPEWRRGPDGARTLCNACGLHYSKLLRKGSLTIQSQGFLLESTDRSKSSNGAAQHPRIIHYPIIQVQAKPKNDASSNRVKFVNSEISYPRDNNGQRICGSKPTDAPVFVTNRIVEVEDE
ncbi:hypothetical protein BJV82DRAFT_669502 [Fennellomyces sp. T-0311]|nr:hypothetical protein BJV82DRAFT_669502 [Fennellomyces sp. T-0311]